MTQKLAAAAGLVLLIGGCAAPSPRGNRLPGGALKLPPPPPPRVNVPLDAGLRREAEAEIARNFAAADPILRANAVEATQKTSGPAQAPRLLAALTDPSPIVRFAGAMACGTLRLEPALARLQSMANDPNKSVQIGVRFALHRLGDAHLSHDFELFARDDEERVRSNTALALGLLGEPSGLVVLRAMQQDVSVPVRLQVIDAMYRLGDTDARDKLVTGTISKYPDDAIVCILALAGPRRPEVLRYVRAELTSEYDETRLAAARAAGMLGQDDGMTIALRAVDSRDARQRSMAALALGDIGRSDGQAALRKLLRDASPPVRLSAATAILQLKAG